MTESASGRAQCRSAGSAGALLALVLCVPLLSQTPAQSGPVAIYYDGPSTPLAEGYLDAHQLQNLLGHFGLSGEILSLPGYKPGHLLRYRAAFFLGTVTGTEFPAAFLADVRSSQQPFCWVGRHIARLLAAPGAARLYGFQYEDYRDDLEFREVQYKGVTLPKEDPDLNLVTVTDSASVEVLATAVNDEKVRKPYALRRGRFWYIADTPFSYAEEGGRYLVFCDLLHDILEIDHPPAALALARIEDVSADIDPADLRALADVLAARRVPFQVALIPVFRNPAKGFEVYLSDRPALVDAIHYMVSRGGTPVLHGVTHQYRGASGDDYEFWDDLGNRPVLGDSRQFVLGRIEQGLREVWANDIFPVAFETPHYAASEADYQALREVFTLFNERTMATPDISAIQYFPFPTVDRFGRYVVPENLGYLTAEKPDPGVLVERARNMRVVRDAVASFYFHAFLDPALLNQVIQGISGLGYQFVSLRRFGGAVRFQSRYIVRTSTGTEKVTLRDEVWRSRQFGAGGRLEDVRFAPRRQSGDFEVPVQVPAGGWAVVDTLKQPQPGAGAPGWFTKLQQWRAGLRPSRRSLGGGVARFSTGGAWVLGIPNPSSAEANNQQSYCSVLQMFGYEVRAVDTARFSPPQDAETILVVPEAAGRRLDARRQQDLLEFLRRGGLVIADGRQEWLASLGFQWSGRRIPIAAVTDVLFPEMPLRWQPEEMVERFTPPPGAEQFMVDALSKQTLALAGAHGSGRYIYLAAPFDSYTPYGTSRYPYLPEYIAEGFRARPAHSSARLEVYFDPSFREGANLNRLAASWRRAGIRTIYAAAWQSYKISEFDYGQFIRACHLNGISVYAWLVLPATTKRMWDEHPEWRERTASGEDGRVGWRYAMNLENPACFRAAMSWMKDTLESSNWDGVNLTELNFDADFLDYLRADRFVPMNADVRSAFRARAGFDPRELFVTSSPYYHKRNPRALDQFLRYREDVVTGWHKKVLSELAPLGKEHGWEVIVTVLDSLDSGYVKPALGVDARRIVELMKQFDFTLQVEDPAEHWMKPPDRYRRFAETWRKLVPQRRLMFDINVMPDRSVAGTTLPSQRATGIELAETVVAAAAVSGRAAIYSEYTVASQDWGLIGAALAQPARIEAAGTLWRLTSSIPLRLLTLEDRAAYINGRLWPAVSPDGLLAPPGRHELRFDRPWYQLLDREQMPARLLHLSGDLLDARVRPTGLTVRYRSPGRTVLLVNHKPLFVKLDGRRIDAPVEAGDGNWAVLVPGGEHAAELETATGAGVVVYLWSYVSASVITAFGALTSVLMVAIYLHLRLRRAVRRGGAA